MFCKLLLARYTCHGGFWTASWIFYCTFPLCAWNNSQSGSSLHNEQFSFIWYHGLILILICLVASVCL